MTEPYTRAAILKAIQNADGWITRMGIAKIIGTKHLTTHHYLSLKHLRNRGFIEAKREGTIWMYRKSRED
jgi:hypothetical protein